MYALRRISGRIGPFARRLATVDARSLGLLRVVLGALLLVDLFDRQRVVGTLYSNDGVLSNHFSLFRPLAPFQFSLYVGASSAREVTAAFAMTALIYALFTLGYRTRVFHLLSLVCVTSLHTRNLMAELPGDAVLHLWLGWSLFLPLGARFSIDARRRSLAAEREGSPSDLAFRPETPDSVTSIAVTGLILQLSAMHIVAAFRQTGESWQEGTALYYALRQSLWVTRLGSWIGQSLPAADLKPLAFGYRAIEVLIGLLVLVPITRVRRASIALLVLFHLSSRALWNFGLYDWTILGAIPLLISSSDWERISDRLGWNTEQEKLDVRSPSIFDDRMARSLARAARTLRETGALLFLIVAGIALARQMSDERAPVGLESVVYRIVAYPRLFQRWGLFAPDPPKRPGTLVAEAETASGAKLDPFTGSPRSPELGPRPDPLLAAYFTNISQPSRAEYVGELREYVRRAGDRRSPADKLVWFNVDWIEAPIVEPDSPASPAEVALAPVSRRITSGP